MAVGWIAACGITEVDVVGLPRVAVFSTGDELASPGTPLHKGQIYDSNRFAVAALLEALPARVTNLGILPDQPNAIEEALSAAARSHDLLLTSGGVSVGDADYVKEVVDSLGALELWRMNMKPGKPLAFGRVADALFLGLPGNPVSTIVTFLLIARPLILRLAGTEPSEPLSITAELEGPLRHNPGREEYQRGVMRVERGKRKVRVSGDQSSNRMATFSGADCLIRISKHSEDLPSGTEVEVLPFQGLLS
jgi:molybdopterin molybdotransferase